MDTAVQIIVTFVPLLISVILHEIAHGLAAERLGDNTARRSGRITLNPLRHIDPFMTIIVPGLLVLAKSPVILGGAKPVPVDFRNLRNPRRDMGIVAIAGPITNIILAVIFGLLYHLAISPAIDGAIGGSVLLFIQALLASGVIINIVLAVFNMLPIPPLDGGRVVMALLPERLAHAYGKLERFGLLIVLLLLYSGAIGHVLDPVISYVYQTVFGSTLE